MMFSSLIIMCFGMIVLEAYLTYLLVFHFKVSMVLLKCQAIEPEMIIIN